MAVGIVLWSVIYQELWGREEKVIAVKWGTSGFEEIEKDRYTYSRWAIDRVCRHVSEAGLCKVAPYQRCLANCASLLSSNRQGLPIFPSASFERRLQYDGRPLVCFMSFPFVVSPHQAELRGRQRQPWGWSTSLPGNEHFPDPLSGAQAKGVNKSYRE